MVSLVVQIHPEPNGTLRKHKNERERERKEEEEQQLT